MPRIPIQKGVQCPHCQQHYFSQPQEDMPIGTDLIGQRWKVNTDVCPACKKITIYLVRYSHENKPLERRRIYPMGTTRPPLPPEVPQDFAVDYQEACEVLPISAKASAALSRRVLQHLLRKQGGVKPQDLAKEIDEVLASKTLPSYITEIVDAIRHYGNFSTHPIEDTQTGSV